ncbi:hypothetical protein HYW87_02640, partial [Candidatus Roizmanbacteria bacterium]|nr:hypothetical protein [Candidatus Roizmanbacteria bacterium]
AGWSSMPLDERGQVKMGIVTKFDLKSSPVPRGAFSAVVLEPTYVENGRSYVDLVAPAEDGTPVHFRARLDDLAVKAKEDDPATPKDETVWLTGYSNAPGGVWAQDGVDSPTGVQTNVFRTANLSSISYNPGEQVVIEIVDNRTRDLSNRSKDIRDAAEKSSQQYGALNLSLINGELKLVEGMELGSIGNLIHATPLT